MIEPERKDLIVLVPDNNIKHGIAELLSRTNSLNMRPISFDIFVHPERDPGIYRKATEFLRPFIDRYAYALICFDHEGCGQENVPTDKLAMEVKERLERNGWQNRAAVIIFDPEVEAWIWTESQHLANEMGWDDYQSLKNWLIKMDLWQTGAIKPNRPKEAFEAALRKKRIPRSSSIYKEIAKKVSLTKCQDQSFNSMKQILLDWFPSK